MRFLRLAFVVLVGVACGAIATQGLTVYDIKAYPNVITSYTYFTATTVPSQTPLDEITVRIYNLGGQLVATLVQEDVYRIYWTGGSLPNGAYLYVASYVNLDPDLSGEFGPYLLYISK